MSIAATGRRHLFRVLWTNKRPHPVAGNNAAISPANVRWLSRSEHTMTLLTADSGPRIKLTAAMDYVSGKA